jgi:hypothetical protein
MMARLVHWKLTGRVSIDEMRREASEAEGARSSLFADRSHLPLRGKLGWMTLRAGVKTTLASKRAFRGSRSQAGAPLFYQHPPSINVRVP